MAQAAGIDTYSIDQVCVGIISLSVLAFIAGGMNAIYQIELAEYISATTRATKSQFVIATHPPILLSMQNAKIYNLDAYPADVCPWTELGNVRKYFDFFMEHRDEFC